VNGIDCIALGIMAHEGFRPGSRSFRNSNPGNLRSSGSPARDLEGFSIWPDFIAGYEALWDDLSDKFTGRDSHGLGPGSTLIDLCEVYAPAADGNDPIAYAGILANWASSGLNRPIDSTSLLREIWTPPTADPTALSPESR
jgi:hypothetical protein